MTAKPQHEVNLETVLNELSIQSAPPNKQTLRLWIEEYPQLAREIIEFATDWIEMEAIIGVDPVDIDFIDTDEVDLIVSQTMSRVQTLLGEVEHASPIVDLVKDAKVAGYDLESFQRAVGIDRSLLDSLSARMARPHTIPTQIVFGMAQVLRRSLDDVRDYFRQPAHQTAMTYKSKRRPAVEQVDFAQLVEWSQLSSSQKAQWLKAPADPELQP